MNHMQERLGSWQVGDDRDSGRASFRVFFPDEERGLAHNIDTIRVCGDFQHYLGGGDWDPASAPQLVREPHPRAKPGPVPLTSPCPPVSTSTSTWSASATRPNRSAG